MNAAGAAVDADVHDRGRALVLMYHAVGTAAWADRYTISPKRFAAHMHALAAAGYRAVPIEALLDWLESRRRWTPGDVVLTFDDGFQGVREHAYPVIRSVGGSATVFLVMDRVGGMDDWHRGESGAPPPQRLLDAEDIAFLRDGGWTLHSHTCTHASLTALADDALHAELEQSHRKLRALLGPGRYCLAYPYGHLDDRVEAAARAAGYRAAFSVQPGFNRPDVNPYRIRRLDVAGSDTPASLLRKLRLGTNDGSLRNASAYYLRQSLRYIGLRGQRAARG